MRTRPFAFWLAACWILTAGCALLGLGGPRALLAEANAAFDRRDLETTYARAKQIRVEHPGSPESREAFALAAYAWKQLYHGRRYVDPDSIWVTDERDFLFDWLASFFGPESPQAVAEVMFVGVDYGVFREFEAFARSRPELSQWRLRAEDDNGIIQSVTAERVEAKTS
jgi:hypothetical protein